MKNENNNRFRCPFQIKAEAEGKVVEVQLDENVDSRFHLIVSGFKYFHETPETVSLRFHLPGSLLKSCNSNDQLKELILPYQSEILAGEIDYRINPFLSYQMKFHQKEELEALFEKESYKFITSHILGQIMRSQGHNLSSIQNLQNWILINFRSAFSAGVVSPQLNVGETLEKVYLSIAPGSIRLHPEEFEEITGIGKNNRNCFGIVMSPFYSKEFGRYSDSIQIVLSRMKDFTMLSSEQRRKIRYKSNSIYREHGVLIDNLEEDKQPDGVWIPTYV